MVATNFTIRTPVVGDLIIESDSLSNLRAICTDPVRYEDQGWYGTQNTDLLKGDLIRLRTGSAQTKFKWVKGHGEDNYSNERADALADTGRKQNISVGIG